LRNIFAFLTIYFIFVPFIFNVNIESIYAISLVAIGIMAFILGNKLKNFSVPFAGSINFESNSIYHIAVTIIGLTLVFQDIINGVLTLSISVKTSNYTESFEVNDYASLYWQIYYLVTFTIKYFLLSLFMARGKLYFYLVFVSQILIFLPSHTRLIALFPFIVFIIYGYYMGYLRVTFLRISLAFVVAPFIFVIMLISRAPHENKSYVQVLYDVTSNLTYDGFISMLKVSLESFQSFEFFVKIVNSNFVHIESGLVRMLFMPVPRDVWPEKPESISRIISSEFNTGQYLNHGGSVGTIFGDGFINGHVFGLLFVMVFFGFMSKFFYKNLTSSHQLDKVNKSIFVLLYSIVVFQFIYLFRGFFSESLWKVILICIVYYSLYHLVFKLSFLKRRFVLK
jgi:hypothetical protein